MDAEMKAYFENNKGIGVLSTADAEGHVNAAIYARPHFLEDGQIAFIMRDRLTHSNVQSNPHAAYLFKEEGPGYKGKRIYLTKIREEKESELLYELRRRTNAAYPGSEAEDKYLVVFRIDKVLPLIGPGRSET